MKVKERGRVIYTGRAFSQDAEEAMGGRIEKALVELITNADDSYARLEEAERLFGKGRILVEVEHRRKRSWKIAVRDRAEGMTGKEMKAGLAVLGGRTSGFGRGQNVRGLLGRGGKDVAAFGTVIWESIKDGRYYGFRLYRNGDWELLESKRASPDIRERLKIPANGVVVTLEVDEAFPSPRHSTLAEIFPRYYSLRDIMSDSKRRVLLVNLNQPGHQGDPLRYRYPAGTLEVDEEFPVPGYPGGIARLRIWSHAERFDEDRSSPYREGGILVKSRRAIHEITLFEFESDPYAAWFFGKLECPHIDTLIEEYDDYYSRGESHTAINPVRIITRRREGLAPEHPFTKALYGAAGEFLQTLVQKKKEEDLERHRRIENKRTRARLDKLARVASRFMAERVKEFEEEVDLSAVLSGGLLRPDLVIIPGGCKIPVGEAKTFSVRAKAGRGEQSEVKVSLCPGSTGARLVTTTVLLEEDPDIGNALRGSFKVQGITVGGRATLKATWDGFEAHAYAEVVEKVSAPEPPDEFCFERSHYYVVYGKEKVIRLLAPSIILKDEGDAAHLVSTNAEIIVRQHLIPLKYSRRFGCAVGTGRIEGRQLNAKGTLRATVGRKVTSAAVQVIHKEGKGPPIKIEVAPEYWGNQRARWDAPEGYLLKIAGYHESVSRYLGHADHGFPGQDTPHFRVLLAEIVTESICERLLRLKEEKGHWGLDRDVNAFYNEHRRLAGHFLPVAHRAMLSASELRALKHKLDEGPGLREALPSNHVDLE